MATNLLSKSSTNVARQESIARLTKAYQADQQVKYLHLQAEIEVLLQQLQTVKINRQ